MYVAYGDVGVGPEHDVIFFKDGAKGELPRVPWTNVPPYGVMTWASLKGNGSYCCLDACFKAEAGNDRSWFL